MASDAQRSLHHRRAFLLLSSCGDDTSRPVAVAVAAHGLSVELPTGWQAAPSSLTPNLQDPREVLAVGGAHASPAVREQAWTSLDRLRVDASVTPDRRSSG